MSRNIWLHVFYTIIVSIVLNVVVFFIGNALGVSWETNQGTVTAGVAALFSGVGAVIGCIGYWILGLVFGDSQRIWFIWLATILGIVSMITPWTGANDLGTMTFLGIMHVISVLVMTWYLGVWAPTYIAAEDIVPSSS